MLRPASATPSAPAGAIILTLTLTLAACSSPGDAPTDAAVDRAFGERLVFTDAPVPKDGPLDLTATDGALDSVDGPASDLPPPPGQPCTLPDYAGWRCLDLGLPSARHGGVTFKLKVRWNLSGAAPKATALWLLGGDGSGSFRSGYNGKLIQDKLETLDQIRSVEIEFADPGGYWRAPAQGYPDAAWVYAQAVLQLKQQGVASGAWITHIGGSNGATIGATALARHNLGTAVKRYILYSGPFAAELAPQCADAASYAYIPTTGFAATARTNVDQWNGWSTAAYCQSKSATAVPSYDQRSPLGSAAARSYPGVAFLTLLGDTDAYKPWIHRSNDNWYNLISAASKRRYVLASVGHDTFGSAATPITPAVQHALDLVYAHARLAPPAEPGPKPAVSVAKSKGGPPAATFAQSDTLHGAVTGVGPAAQACMETAGQGLCAQLSGWTTMPNSDWSYDAATQRWSCAIPLAGVAKGTYHMWWRDSASGQHTDRLALILQ